MVRKPRIHLTGGLYHVILRGNGGQPVFLTDEDRCRFYLLIQEGTCRFDYYGGEEDLRVLGDDTFMEKCLAGSSGRPLRLTIKDIVSAVCLSYNLDESMLKTRTQQRTLS
ncbi:hypothetical protein [Candidatus Electrothrix sp.]|uniref:hypothetical protein n=1 Tax=Candidatus Electrothrix sp. TaxID=2170559 RepID=UPI0040569818